MSQEIVAAAWDLVETDHIVDFTVKQVTERAEVALQTFYRHFGTKDELLLAMFEESMHRAARTFIAESLDAEPVERLHHLVTVPFHLHYDESGRRGLQWRARERQRLLDLFPEAVEAVYEPFRAALADAIVGVCETGEARCDDPDLTATVILHLVQSLVHSVHGGGLAGSPTDVSEAVWQLCWQGLAEQSSPAAEQRSRT